MTPLPAITALLNELRQQYSPDYWAEVEVRCSTALDSLSDDDWAALTHAIGSEAPLARLHLAQALRHLASERATLCLSELLRGSDAEVGAAAAGALFEQYQFWLPGVSIRAELQRHLASAEPVLHARLAALLARATD